MEHDHMIEAFATNGANHPLNIGSLPRRARCRQDPELAVARGKFWALSCRPVEHSDLMRKARFSSPSEARDRKIEAKDARSVVRKMSIGENYVEKLTPMRSNISRFSRGTVRGKTGMEGKWC